jgi:hypothetical protein
MRRVRAIQTGQRTGIEEIRSIPPDPEKEAKVKDVKTPIPTFSRLGMALRIAARYRKDGRLKAEGWWRRPPGSEGPPCSATILMAAVSLRGTHP